MAANLVPQLAVAFALAATVLSAPGAGSQGLLAGPSVTGTAIDERLTGGQSKDWLKVRESVFMGSGGCKSGERWRFAQPDVLRIRRCIDGRWVVSQHRWRPIADAVGKTVLIIHPSVPESGRRILFSDDGRTAYLRLMPGTKTSGFSDTALQASAGSAPAF